MAKRQQRFTAADLPEQAEKLKGKKVSMVMKNQRVWFVEVADIDKQSLKGKDMLGHLHTIKLSDIDEIIQEY